jgi:glyoxylase-like metal-dependent hydrolase (beta-lactamase superfamily II)
VSARPPFTKGLHALGDGCWAYLQPDGSWGWSNAGLIESDGAALLVDTLFDLKLTREMLDAMRRATPAAERIGTVVNTHANGDHCYGNALVRGASIVASKACAEEMAHVTPSMLAGMVKNADSMGPAGAFFKRAFGAFEFDGIGVVLPDRTFEGRLELRVGRKPVELLEVGPAHTRGDVLVHSPADRAIFTGDILFIGGTPIMWNGPVANWIRACERIEALDVDWVVPGHGPVTDRSGARAVREYLIYVRDEARKRFDAGLSVEQAARDIALGEYRSWLDRERIAVNVDALYREFAGGAPNPSPANLFALMAELARD